MHHKMNDKIIQVSAKTLVIGIDIAKYKHYACAVDDRGLVLERPFAFHQSTEGFHRLLKTIFLLQTTHEKVDVIVGFEPTGHYWMNLARFLRSHGVHYVIVNPLHVKRSKELDDNHPAKTDAKDARIIAKLVRDGRYSHPRVLEGLEAELRVGVSLRERLQKRSAILKNQMIRWMDLYFPELQLLFKEIGKHTLAVLQETPLPADVDSKDIDGLVQIYRASGHLKFVYRTRIRELKESASCSLGLTEGTEMARLEIRQLVDELLRVQHQIEDVSVRMIEIVQELPDYHFLVSIPGIGSNSAVEILSETGPFTNYDSPRQLIKLAGLALTENSSGTHKGRKRISKRGRKRLRSVLFRAVLPLIQFSSSFRALYEYYTTRPVNPLKKKEAMVVLCGKLLKVGHGLCTKGVSFDEHVMRRDITCLAQTA